MIAPGTRLGPYVITAPIGAGGMGEVYKATDTRLDRTVAIKVLPEHVAADPDLKQRFEREAKTLAALSHPHICTLHDVGSQDGIDFLVMEYLEGETLEQRLKKGALPLDQALQIGIQIADALDSGPPRRHRPSRSEARQHHADEVGREAARFRAGEDRRAGSRWQSVDAADDAAGPDGSKATILGTFQYMAPEQLEGHGGRRAHRHLRVRRGALRDGHGEEGVRGEEPGEPDRGDSGARAAGDVLAAAADARHARSRREPVSRQRRGRAMANGR